MIKRGRERALLTPIQSLQDSRGKRSNYREFCGGTMEYSLGNIINVNVKIESLELGVIATTVKEKQQGLNLECPCYERLFFKVLMLLH